MHPTRALLGLLLSGALLGVAGAAQAVPEDRGPLAIEEYDAGSVQTDGVSVPLLVIHPSAPGPYPLLVVMHGFVRSGRYMHEMAATLASRGFVALVPDMPCGLSGCDHQANARQLSGLLDYGLAEGQRAGSPLYGQVDPVKLGLVGHSWGGLAAFLCAAQDPRVLAVAHADPNDDMGLVGGVASTLLTPSIHVMASNPGNCNGDWDTSVFPSTASPHLRVRVVGSGHCDVEDPSDGLCTIACGRGDRSTSHLFRRYAVSFLGCMLKAEPEYAPYLGGMGLADDQAQGLIDQVDGAGLASLPCQASNPAPDAGTSGDAATPPPNDAGVSSPDADADAGSSTPDLGTPIAADAGAADTDAMVGPSAPDAGTADPDAGPATLSAGGGAEDASSGCRSTHDLGRAPAPLLGLLLLGALALTSRR